MTRLPRLPILPTTMKTSIFMLQVLLTLGRLDGRAQPYSPSLCLFKLVLVARSGIEMKNFINPRSA